jgi:hypothetical protein
LSQRSQYAESCYAECRPLNVFRLSVILLNVVAPKY